MTKISSKKYTFRSKLSLDELLQRIENKYVHPDMAHLFEGLAYKYPEIIVNRTQNRLTIHIGKMKLITILSLTFYVFFTEEPNSNELCLSGSFSQVSEGAQFRVYFNAAFMLISSIAFAFFNIFLGLFFLALTSINFYTDQFLLKNSHQFTILFCQRLFDADEVIVE